MFLPKPVTYQRYRRSVRSIILGRNCATQHRFRAKRRQVICHYCCTADTFRLSSPCQIERTCGCDARASETMSPIPIRGVLQEWRPERIKPFAQRYWNNQPIDVLNWQGPKQKCVGGTEDRGVRTNAQTKRGDRDGRVTWRLQQHSRAVANVLPQTSKHKTPLFAKQPCGPRRCGHQTSARCDLRAERNARHV